MSNELTVIPDTDITEIELGKIQLFKEQGLPGIGDVTDAQLHRMLDLYLTGSTYTQISNLLGVKKIYILYLSQSSGWYTIKKEYLCEIQEKIKNRVIDAKLRNSEFMLTLVQSWQKKIGNQLNRYLATNDPQHMEDIDLKEVTQLMKAIEMVNELDNSGKDSKGKTPAIGLNIGGGVNIQKTGNDSISITPKETSIGDMLEQYANERRDKEKETSNKRSDISNITEGENNEKK